MSCELCITYQSQLKLMTDELDGLRKKYADCKQKPKPNPTELQPSKDIINEISVDTFVANSEKDQAVLYARAVEAEKKVENLSKENTSLKNKLAAKEIELNDHIIKIRNLEEQLLAVLGSNVNDTNKHSMEVEVVTRRDLDRMHSQLLYKDTRIMELNSTILDKERQILDLQEMCREQCQVVQARSKAFQIVQQRVIEMDSRKTRDISTETDVSLTVKGQGPVSIFNANIRKENSRRFADSSTPGRAVMLLKTDRHSPPPLDPSEDQSSVTTETLTFDEGERMSLRKHRKKVTFDLKPQRTINVEGLTDSVCDDIAQAVIDLTSENDELRNIIRELENDTVASAHSRIAQLEDEIEKVRREGKNQALKAKAAAQGRIRDLEEKIASEQEEYKEEINRLKSTVEALRATREWNVEENARLLEQIATTKRQCDEIKEELSGSLLEQDKLRNDSGKDREMIVRLAGNVEEAQRTVNSLLEQRVSILDDVDRLKEAIEAQDEYIAMLEDDVIIYEEHIGLLRDSLGASKVENRAFIKSKAFETKLRALEQEKEQITKRSNDDRVLVRALNAKIRSLESQNSELTEKLKSVDGDSSCVQRLSALSEHCSYLVADDGESTPDRFNFSEHFRNSGKGETYAMDNQIYATSSTGNLSQSMPNLYTTSEVRKSHTSEIVNYWAGNDCRTSNIERSPEVANLLVHELQKEDVQDKMVQTLKFADDESVVVESLRDELKIAKDECKLATDVARELECAKAKLEVDLNDTNCRLQELQLKNKNLEVKLTKVISGFGSGELNSQINENAENDVHLALLDKEVQILEDELEDLYGRNGIVNLDQVNNNPATYPETLKNTLDNVKEIPVTRGEVGFTAPDEDLIKSQQLATDNSCDPKLVTAEQELLNSFNTEHNALIDSSQKLLKREVLEKESKIILLQSAIAKYKTEFENIKQCQEEKELLEQELTKLKEERDCIIEHTRMQVQKEFAAIQDVKEAVFAEKELSWQTSLENKDAELLALQEKVGKLKETADDDEVMRRDYEFLKANLKTIELEKNSFLVDLESNRQKLKALEEEKSRLVQLLEESKAEYSSLKDMYTEVRSNFETAKQQLHEFSVKLDLLTEENEAKTRRINELNKLEIASSRTDEGYNEIQLTVNERDNLLRQIEILNNDLNEYRKQQLPLSKVDDEDKVMCSAESDDTYSKKMRLSVVEVSLESVPTISAEHRKPDVLLGSDAVESREKSSLEIENVILRECVAQNTAMQNTLSEDVDRLLEIKTELETTVETLKGEIWALDARLKDTIADRDNLSDKLCALTHLMEDERAKAKERERELEEQKNFAERNQRQAALAENDSNNRLVEWKEKNAEMEDKYTQLRSAYEQLNVYYQQVQEAYNALYASVGDQKIERKTEVGFDCVAPSVSKIICCNKTRKYLVLMHEIVMQLKKELKELKENMEECSVGLKSGLHHAVETAVLENKRILSQCLARENAVFENIQRISSLVIGREVTSMKFENLSELVSETVNCLQTQGKDLMELREALEEKRATCDVLESRLEEYERISEQLPSQRDSYIADLEKMLAVAQDSLNEQVRKTDELRAKMEMIGSLPTDSDEMKSLAERSTLYGDPSSIQSTSAAVHMICRGTHNVPCSANLQLAILAARLTAKESDNEALLRCNEELAETNLKLQNELDSLSEKLRKVEENRDKIATTEKSKFMSSAECLDNNEDGWDWDATNSDNISADSCIAESNADEVILKQLQSKEKEIRQLHEKEKTFIEEIKRREKRLQAAEEYGIELEEKLDKLEALVEDLKAEAQEAKLNLPVGRSNEKLPEPDLCLSLECQVKELREENKLLQLKISRLQQNSDRRTVSSKLATAAGDFKINCRNSSQQQVAKRVKESCYGAELDSSGGNDYEVDSSVTVDEEVNGISNSDVMSSGTDIRELKATITKLNEELNAVIKSRGALENELLLSNERSKSIQLDFEKLKKQFQVCKKDVDNVQVPSIETSFVVADDEKVFEGSYGEYEQDGTTMKQGLHLNEKSYLALVDNEKSLRQLLEDLELKLHNTEEYSINLKEKNVTLESAAATMKEELAQLKLEIKELKKTNETLQFTNDEAKKQVVTYMAMEVAKKSLEEELLAVQMKVNQVSSTLNAVEKEKAEANATIEAMLLVTKEMTEAAVQIDVCKAVEQLKDQLNRIIVEKKTLEEELAMSKKQNELLKDCECRLTEVVNDYEIKTSVNAKEIQNLKKFLKKANDQCITLEKERLIYADEKEQMEKTLSESKRDFELISAELRKLKREESAEKPIKKATGIQTKALKETRPSSSKSHGFDATTQEAEISNEDNERKNVYAMSNPIFQVEGSVIQIKELKTECDKLTQEKKRLLRKVKQLQSELNTLRKNTLNDFEDDLASSSSVTLPSDSFATNEACSVQNSANFLSSFAVDETRVSVDSHPLEIYTDDEDKVSQTSKSSRDSTFVQSLFQRISASVDEPVRRRRSGFRGDTGK